VRRPLIEEGADIKQELYVADDRRIAPRSAVCLMASSEGGMDIEGGSGQATPEKDPPASSSIRARGLTDAEADDVAPARSASPPSSVPAGPRDC
jgi:succinyl-CoA synthetase beta subunit